MFSWGANSHGQLGINNLEDKHAPTEVNFNFKPSIICGGGGISIALKNSSVYATGQLSQLKSQVVTQFKLIDQCEKSNSAFIAATAGWDFSLLLNASGNLFVLGSNILNFPQNPINHCKWVDSLTRLSLPPMRGVSAGLRHAVTISKSDNVHYWTCEDAVDREFHSTNEIFITKIKENVGSVIDCSSGAYHSALLTDTGNVCVLGNSRFGEGGPLTSGSVAKRSRYDLSNIVNWISSNYFNYERIVSIKSGWSHILALTESGKVFSWGRCDFGQLGRKPKTVHLETASNSLSRDNSKSWPVENKHFDPIPSQVNFEPVVEDEEICVKSIITGSEHCLAIDTHCRLWSWGWNEHGMCGLSGNSTDRSSQLSPSDVDWCIRRPQLVRFPGENPFPTILCVGSGYGHSLAYVDGK